jgi:hypothetical protein
MATIFIRPDGRIEGLYSDAIPLQQLGKLSVTRATTIEFDPLRQEWVVALPDGKEVYSHPSREQCLKWEKTFCEALLSEGFRPGSPYEMP